MLSSSTWLQLLLSLWVPLLPPSILPSLGSPMLMAFLRLFGDSVEPNSDSLRGEPTGPGGAGGGGWGSWVVALNPKPYITLSPV